MRIVILSCVLLTICFSFIPAKSAMYQWTDENGSLHFSNTQPPVQNNNVITSKETVEDPATREKRLEQKSISDQAEISAQTQISRGEVPRRPTHPNYMRMSPNQARIASSIYCTDLDSYDQKLDRIGFIADSSPRSPVPPNYRRMSPNQARVALRIYQADVNSYNNELERRGRVANHQPQKYHSNQGGMSTFTVKANNAIECEGDCANDQGMCIGSCQGADTCISSCVSMKSRCTSRCNR